MAVSQADVAALQADIVSLNRAIADGVRQVTLGDQTVTYNTTDSLIRARDDAQDRLRAAQRELSAQGADAMRRGRLMLLSQRDRGYH